MKDLKWEQGLLVLSALAIVFFKITFGTLMLLGFSVALLCLGITRILGSKQEKSPWNTWNKLIKIGLSIWALSFIIVITILMSHIKYELKEKDYQCILVLGAGLYGDKVSPVLQSRLDQAYMAAMEKPEVPIIVSGGQGENELVSEAKAMSDYLVNQGIAEERIIMEDQSTTTMENFKFSYDIIKEMKGVNDVVLVVTSDFHMYRTELIGKKYPFKMMTLCGRTEIFPFMNFVTREYLAIVKTFIIDPVIRIIAE